MLRIYVRKGVIGEGDISTHDFPYTDGMTARSVALSVQEHLPKAIPIDIGLNGKLIEDGHYDDPLSDGDELILCAATTGAVVGWLAQQIVYALIAAAISVAINYALASTNPQPTVPDVPQDRGDETSATYSWLGIQTNYGQGYNVGAVYGRHGVGGQVISTDTVGETFISGFLDDRLNIIIALSEGPIHAIGDVEITGQDFLGSVTLSSGESLSQGSLPNFVRVNETLLSNDGNAVTAYELTRFPGSLWTPAFPELPEGAYVHAFALVPTPVQLAGLARIVRVEGDPANPIVYVESPPAAWVAFLAANPGAGFIIGLTAGGIPPGIPNTATPWASCTGFLLRVFEPDSAGAWAFFRKGEIGQEPMPSTGAGPFTGAAVTFSPNATIDDFQDVAIFAYNSGDDPLTRVSFLISAPNGIYSQNSQGGNVAYPIALFFRWRFEGETTWRFFVGSEQVFVIGQTATTGPQIWSPSYGFGQEVDGSIEVSVLRDTADGDFGTVSSLVWRDVVFATGVQLEYPRVALLGLSLQANARWQGGLPNFNVRVDGILVRVWDSVNGFSSRTWNVPAAPFNWHTYPPGRNPAWILLDFLLQPWGLGNYLTEADLDLPAFAAWAVYCDRDPAPATPWNEPQYTCDLVIDRSRPAWEWVLAICACGRASPVSVNGKVSVVYEYRDAHAQGSVSVPVKAASQLFSSGNLSGLNVTWLPRSTRPTAYVYQFLNEDFEWRQDVVPFEDPEGTFNDQSELFPDKYRPQQVQGFGQTRAAQLYRDAVYKHRVNRLVTRKVEFVTGRWALVSQIGDLIDLETEVMRPFDKTAYTPEIPFSGCVFVGGTGVSALTVDHVIVATSGQIKVRGLLGAPAVQTWNAVTPTTVLGKAATILTLDGTISCLAGSPCVFGVTSKLVETYMITALVLNKDLTRTVTCLQWVPAIFDEIDPDDFNTGGGDDGGSVITEPAASPDEPTIDDGLRTASPTGLTQGRPATSGRDLIKVEALPANRHRIHFARMPKRQSVTARVFMRHSAAAGWNLLGETTGGFVDYDHFVPHRTYQVSVAFDRFDGDAVMPERGVIVTVAIPEFTQQVVPPITSPVWSEKQNGVVVSWDEVTALGVQLYEIREGTNWNGGRVLYRGQHIKAEWDVPPQSATAMICAQLDDGSQGNPLALAVSSWSPYGSVTHATKDVIAEATLFGSHFGTLWTSPYIELESDKFAGHYLTASVSPGFLGPYLWRVSLDVHEYDGVTVDQVRDHTLGSGEAAWRTVDGRGASPALPGVDWERDVDDAFLRTVDSYNDELIHGPLGEAGSHTNVTIESRFSVNGGAGWTEWAEHRDGVHVADLAEFRLTLERETLTHEAQVHGFKITAQL